MVASACVAEEGLESQTRPRVDGQAGQKKGSSRPPAMSIRAPDETVVDMRPVLHLEEVARARVFFRSILAIAALTAAFIPALAGERWLRLLAVALCTVVSILCAGVLLLLRNPARYTATLSTTVGVVCSVFGVVVMYYIGLFSAGVMILVVGLYFFGTSHSRVTARATYGTIAVCYLVASVAVAGGWLEDRALFSTAAAQPFTRWFQVVMSQVIFAFTFYLARSSRRATEAAVDRVQKANLQIQKKDALLAEARGDLARATVASTGRHTGQRIGTYQVGEILGRGAMGEVYRAEDRGGLPVALKLLHPALLDNPTKVKRFLREAEAASAAKSPHVPRVFATGWTDDGSAPWLAMELLEGHDLGWHLRKTGKLRLDLVVEMVEHVARALADVREAGVVHRDLKPANLFLTDSLPRNWKVLDFGLSKILWESGSLTRDHAVGTPSYMSPEQVKGPTVDHLADLYALAAIAYRAITGIPPFAGDEVAHVLYRVLYQQPVCPGELSPVPIDMELVLAIGLAKNRDDRFERVEDLAAAMRAALEGKLDDDIRTRGWNLVKRMPWGSSQKPPDDAGATRRGAA
jgi:eukaryotic-like serine/threonine-protein kinase